MIPRPSAGEEGRDKKKWKQRETEDGEKCAGVEIRPNRNRGGGSVSTQRRGKHKEREKERRQIRKTIEDITADCEKYYQWQKQTKEA